MARLSCRRAALTALLAGCAVAFAACAQSPGPEPATARADITLVNAAGKRHLFHVEIAESPAARRRGLMFREQLDPDAGMLFLYQPAQPVSMWMKNTLLPLDILFIDPRGRVTRIARNAVPLSTTTLPSGGTVRAVLEIGGGMAEFLGINPGDQLVYAPLWPERPAP